MIKIKFRTMIMKLTDKEKYSEIGEIKIYSDFYSNANYALLPIKGKCVHKSGVIYCLQLKQEEKQNEINK